MHFFGGRDQEVLVHSVCECLETHTEPGWGINDECLEDCFLE